MNVTVRPMKQSDREPLLGMLKTIEAFRPEEVDVAMELVDIFLTKPQQTDYRILVADDGPRLAGYICFGPTPMTRGTFDLYWIASSNQARGKGAGSALITEMEKKLQAEGARIVRIETSSLSEYQAARTFYARHHYDRTAVIEGFYTEGDDLVMLTKRLDR